MTELEKIAYAKSFIDKLANGVNPLDDTPIPEGDIVNNVRLSRCFFYVSGILQKAMERERRKMPKEKKPAPLPFSITWEELQRCEYSDQPISASAMARKINWLVKDAIDQKRMERLSYRRINQWLYDIGMIEWREWEDGRMKRFPTAEGEAIGLVLSIWESYGRSAPVIYFSEEAQRFIIDHMEAIVATGADAASQQEESDEESED